MFSVLAVANRPPFNECICMYLTSSALLVEDF